MATTHIAEVGDDTFEAEVVRAAGPVLVDFWAPWCGPCRAMEPLLDELAGSQGGRMRVVKLNIDEHDRVASELEVLSIPTLILFDGGEVRRRITGAVPRRRLEEELADWL